MIKMINELYKELLLDVYVNGDDVSPRGMRVKEKRGVLFTLPDSFDNIITLPYVSTNVDYANEELNWFLEGDGRIDFSPKIERVWERFSDDGIRVNSNYGERIFGKHSIINVNQWNYIKDLLKKDSDSRQALFNINSYFDKKESKDVPCCISGQFFVRNNDLEFIVNMRSNDLFLGFRNDVFVFTMLQRLMSLELGLNSGIYKHFMGSAHIYEKDFKRISKIFGV